MNVVELSKIQLPDKNEVSHTNWEEAVWLCPEFPVSQIAPLSPIYQQNG